MDSPQPMVGRHCPQCGTEIPSDQSVCWLCHNANESATEIVGHTPDKPLPTVPTHHGLSSLLLFITLLIILGSIFSIHPGLGVMAAILAVPALLRTCFVAARRTEGRAPVSAGGKIAIFAATAGMCIVVIVASAAAFFFTCFATVAASSSSPSSFGAGLLLGGIVGIAVAVILARLFWNISRRNRNG